MKTKHLTDTPNNSGRKIPIHLCLRCSWNWPQRGEEKPRRCPKCGSPYWDVPRKRKKTNLGKIGYGKVLKRKKGESTKNLVKRQTEEFKK